MPTAEDDGLGRTKCMRRKVDDVEERRIGVDEGEGNQSKRINEFGANQTEKTPGGLKSVSQSFLGYLRRGRVAGCLNWFRLQGS
jgi:hypothetical protein